jgi:Binding-protein-dependent transport system inner membrane component
VTAIAISVVFLLLGAHTPAWMTETRSAQSAVIIMSLFTIGEGFIVAMATRQAIPSELYELGDLESAKPLYMFWRVTLPFMAPTLLLLLFRDTIFSFQVSFVPALLVTQGGPENATLYLPLFIYRHAFEYLHYGYAAAATVTMFPGYGGDRVRAVPDREALAPRFCRLALRAVFPPKVSRLSAAGGTHCTGQRANVPAHLEFQLGTTRPALGLSPAPATKRVLEDHLQRGSTRRW